MSSPEPAENSRDSHGPEQISQEIVPTRSEAPSSLAEAQLYEAQIKNTNLILANQAIGQDTEERKKYARRFLYLACAWVAIVTLVLLLQGACSRGRGAFTFALSDTVLLATIGSTTANILGILYVVANYLFPKK